MNYFHYMQNNNCEFQVTLPYLDFCPNPKLFIVQNINEWNLVKYGGNIRMKSNISMNMLW